MIASVSRLVQILVDRARTDPELADALRDIAQDLFKGLNAAQPEDQELTAELPAPETASESAESPREHLVAPAADEPSAADPATEPLAPTDLDRLMTWARDGGAHGDGAEGIPPEGERARDAATDAVLAPMAARFRLKAAAARWHAEGADPRRLPALRSHFGEVKGLDSAILDDAITGQAEDWGRLADAYEAAGTAADVLSAFADAGLVLRPASPFAEAVVVAAEAQSAVRAAYWTLRGRRADEVSPHPSHDDADQVDLFRWLREATDVDQVYVGRYMRWQDPADPGRAGAAERQLRAIAASAGVSLQAPRPAATARHLKAVAYHAGRLAQDAEYWDAEHQRERLLSRVDDAMEAGVPPTDVRLRALLAPIADALPDADDPAVPPRAGRVLAALYDHLYGQDETASGEARAASPARSPHVERAAGLLAGKRLALFGGVPRPDAEAALARALDLASVEWVETRVHQSTAPFEAVVARSDVAVQLIRWSSHSFGDLRDQCEAHGTLFVRATGGYNPSAIAQNVLDQISDELHRAR